MSRGCRRGEHDGEEATRCGDGDGDDVEEATTVLRR